MKIGDLFTAFHEALQVVDRLRLATERHSDHAVRVEFNNHPGTLVNHPHVVVLIHANGMGEGRSVVIRPPLLDEFIVFVEFEKLCGRAAACTTSLAGARVHKQVTL